ncbi:MAG: succinate dehydrogenase/fumarate reductase cytochrome b subunit [Bacteroidaceae bacterium]|nr:succinate dehydrogenase/fumarate reductase cytochrome b subunit [Bacteroidaceae bacterium]
MWLIDSSIGRKVVMSVTGMALILFLTFHMAMNCVALFSEDGYRAICEFLGANWYALVGTVGLAALMVIHFIYAFWLSWQNYKARGSSRYAVTERPKTVEWSSQNMLVIGIIVCIGLFIHLINFWSKMQLVEIMGDKPADGVDLIRNTFSKWYFALVYLVWLFFIWLHLTHGFWSAIQTVGWSSKVWHKRWKVIGNVCITLLILGFASVLVLYFGKSLMA